MAKHSASRRPAKKSLKTNKKATTKGKVRKAPAKKKAAPKASGSRKAAAKRAAKLKAIEAARVAEQTAAATVSYAPPPFEADADPSRAPGKQHRHPPVNDPGPKHSQVAIPRMRAPFNRRMNIGR